MTLSYRVRYLLIVSISIIILAIAANEGAKVQEGNTAIAIEKNNRKTPYPQIPADIDPGIIDTNIDSENVTVPKRVAPAVVRPEVSAEAYLVANLETGEIYSEHNSQTVFPIASLSKLITALVVLHSMQPDQKVTLTQTMLDAYGDAGDLSLGETFTTADLLYPMLLESSNDAAEAFAESFGYTSFLAKMNGFASGLGMTSTSFKDSSGLSAGNRSDAHDLFILSQYLYTSEKPLLEITRQTTKSVASTTDHLAHTWTTINPFPLDPHFMGGKTGRTNEAKESMISMFRYDHNGVSYPVVVIVLRSDFSVRELDSSVLFERFIKKIGAN